MPSGYDLLFGGTSPQNYPFLLWSDPTSFIYRPLDIWQIMIQLVHVRTSYPPFLQLIGDYYSIGTRTYLLPSFPPTDW